MVRGALLPLIDAANFESFGAVSPDETAARFMLMVDDFFDQFEAYSERVKAIFGSSSLVAYWPLWEPSGSVANDISGNARHGTYTNVTLGQTGIGDGRTSASYNGTTSSTNIYSTSLRDAFNGAAGTLAIWGKVSGVGVWTDTLSRFLAVIQASSINRVIIQKSASNNRLSFTYTANNVPLIINHTPFSPTTFFHAVLTWDKAADEVKAYVNGVQSGSTLTGLGVWAGLPASANSVIGAATTTPTTVWSGILAHVAVGNRALSAAEILDLEHI